MKYLLGLLLPLYLLDQATKWLVVHTFAFQEQRTVIPGFFDLVYWGNTGAAFSIMQGKSPFFIVLATATLIAMAIFAWRGALKDAWSRTSWCLLAAGIAGNLTDRIVHGHVVDFLLFYLHIPFANPWPAFNVADSCICIAAGMLIWQALRQKDPLK